MLTSAGMHLGFDGWSGQALWSGSDLPEIELRMHAVLDGVMLRTEAKKLRREDFERLREAWERR